jgi:hypothetical protein
MRAQDEHGEMLRMAASLVGGLGRLSTLIEDSTRGFAQLDEPGSEANGRV